MNKTPKKMKPGKGPFDVTRKILLAPTAPERWHEAVTRLKTIEPIIDANIDQNGRLRISYDASCVGMRDIEPLLDEMSVYRASGFWSRIKLSWYRFLDENAKSNAVSGGGACCNRPPAAHDGSSDAGKAH
ncbi:hypothetical protein [Sulfurirhabdus autotrophica]|nr:hypothetical protein [Sulfurirhabdus autotrophica]